MQRRQSRSLVSNGVKLSALTIWKSGLVGNVLFRRKIIEVSSVPEKAKTDYSPPSTTVPNPGGSRIIRTTVAGPLFSQFGEVRVAAAGRGSLSSGFAETISEGTREVELEDGDAEIVWERLGGVVCP